MTDEIVEIADADGEKDVPGNQLFDDGGRVHRRLGDQAMAINETINPMTRKVSGKFDRTKVMAAVMKSAMAIDA